MANILVYWTWRNYQEDITLGAGFNFNSSQIEMHTKVELGDTVWAVTATRLRDGTEAVFVVARLVIKAKTQNPPNYKYGKYRLWGDIETSSYYKAQEQDNANVLVRSLEFSTGKTIGNTGRPIGQYLQTIRSLTTNDHQLLLNFSAHLASEPLAARVPEEMLLEAALELGEEATEELLKKEILPSEEARNRIEGVAKRSPARRKELYALYNGQCQMGDFNPRLLYGVDITDSHHIQYIGRGGADDLSNMILLCPNHHRAIHATNAVFDYSDLCFVFGPRHRQPVVLNDHLGKSN